MKDREKIAARSGLGDPKELQELIAFKGQQEINKKIADIRDTTSIWEQQDRGYVADIESSARDIEGGAASGRAMEGPMGAKARSDKSKTLQMEQLLWDGEEENLLRVLLLPIFLEKSHP